MTCWIVLGRDQLYHTCIWRGGCPARSACLKWVSMTVFFVYGGSRAFLTRKLVCLREGCLSQINLYQNSCMGADSLTLNL